jgi:hypothetical protein
LDDAKAGYRGDILVEPPAQALVELLGLLDIGHRDDVNFEIQGDTLCFHAVACGIHVTQI